MAHHVHVMEKGIDHLTPWQVHQSFPGSLMSDSAKGSREERDDHDGFVV